MQNYELMTIQQLQQEFARQGRAARKLLAGGTYGAMSRQEMVATLTRWDKQDEAIQAKAESWAEANSCKLLGDNPVWKRWMQEAEKQNEPQL